MECRTSKEEMVFKVENEKIRFHQNYILKPDTIRSFRIDGSKFLRNHNVDIHSLQANKVSKGVVMLTGTVNKYANVAIVKMNDVEEITKYRMSNSNTKLLGLDDGDYYIVPENVLSCIKKDVKSDFFESPECVQVRLSLPVQNIKNYLGSKKGIEGNRSSCFMNTFIFSLFLKSDCLDFLMNKPSEDETTIRFQEVLKHEIVYPLREFGFVSFHHTQNMMEVIKNYGNKFAEMMNKESDMENVSSLFSRLCPDEQLLSVMDSNSNVHSSMFLHLLFTVQNPCQFMTSQTMIDLHMMQNNIFFNKDPTTLIVQACRGAMNTNGYNYFLPSPEIEISQLISNRFKKCFKCSEPAILMCSQCTEMHNFDVSCGFACRTHKCTHHLIVSLKRNGSGVSNKKVTLVLRSVISIDKSHFRAFVKDNFSGEWISFDSMNEPGFWNNFPIPKVQVDHVINNFLNMSTEGMKREVKDYGDGSLKCIVRDAHIFVYQNPAKTCY